MNQIGRRFGLSHDSGTGVSCDDDGVFVGGVPLLERSLNGYGSGQWQARPVTAINRDLGKRYGLPVDCNSKLGGLAAVANALNRGDLLHARIATLHLRLPDPPVLKKSQVHGGEIPALAAELRASGLLKADWDPAKHPRWPAGSADGIGGEFAPAGAAGGDASEPEAQVIPAQITVPFPPDWVMPDWLMPRQAPFPNPSEITPGPLVPPSSSPRELKNPYPDRPGCEEEWAEAIQYCARLLGRPWQQRIDRGRMGRNFYKCVMGQVSARCGGYGAAV